MRLQLKALMLLIGVLLISTNANAAFIHGFVYTRDIVTNEAGNYTWGEYNPQTGAYVRDIGEATGELNPSQWRVMSGDEYRSIVAQKNALHEAQPDLVLMSRADYLAANILLADGTSMLNKPNLGRTTAYVSILPQPRRLIDDPASLILAEYPINPDVPIAEDILSLLHGYSGDVLGQTKQATTNRIGFKVAFAKDGSGNPVPLDQGVRISGGNEYEAVGPIEGAIIEGWLAKTTSGSNGAFSLYSIDIPCPGFYYVHDTRVWVELRYRRFNPRARSRSGLYMDSYPSSVVCTSSFFMVPLLGPFPTGWSITTYPSHAIQFAIDLTVLSGTAQLSQDVSTTSTQVALSGNKVPIGGATQYQAQTPDNTLQITPDYDFDRDETLDTIVAGHMETDAEGNEIFVVGAPEELQGVWLSSSGNSPQTGQPDFTRVMDSASFAEHSHQGLLSAISAEDLRNTDIYIVRVSDGKLISERIGLNEYEAGRISALGEDAGNSQFFYTIQMQGSTGDKRFRYNFFENWQAASGINPDLHQRQSDHLQPGDAIRIYAINRATGYIGHVDTVMQAGTQVSGDLSFHIDPIIMGPPNLKIRAERGYKIEKGLTASDENITQLIGFEGASLTSDNTVTITTEWLDHDGRPLPESLAGAGYTGRIAILSADKTLSSDNQGVYQFSIDPGRRLQVLQLPNALTDNEHFYIHISGEPQSGNPIFAGSTSNQRLREADFSSSGQNPGILAKRPDNYVPFLVPVYDEAANELQTQALFKLRQENPGQVVETPDPIYRWVYRPEMQFTSYDLTVSEINRTRDIDGSGTIEAEETINIIDNEFPLVSSDSVISLLYDLSTTELLPLDYFNAGEDKELVFVIGEQEIAATLGSGQTLTFEDLSHLSLLSPDDFTTLRLYANNDMGNVLLEWAFSSLYIDLAKDHELIAEDAAYVTADEPTLDLAAFIGGYALLSDEDLQSMPDTIQWRVAQGSASVNPVVATLSEDGVATTTVTLAPDTDNVVVVEAYLVGDETGKARSFEIGVIAGSPSTISLTQAGSAYIKKHGQTEVTATVADAHGNLVEDGTPIFFRMAGHAFIDEYQGFVFDGQSKAIVKGGSISGSYNLTVDAGPATAQTSIAIAPLTLELIGAPDNMEAGNSYAVTARVTDAAANPVGNVFVDIGVAGAIIETDQVNTDASGEVTFNIIAPEIDGPITLAAKVDRDQPVTHTMNNTRTSTQSIQTSSPFIVAGLNGSATTTFTSFGGTSKTLEHAAGLTLSLSGTAGQPWSLAFDDYHLINRAPIMFNRFRNPFWDQSHTYLASFTNIRKMKTPYFGIYGLYFDGAPETGVDVSSWHVKEHAEFQVASPAYNFWLNAEAAGKVLSVANGSLELTLNADHSLTATLYTSDASEITLTTAPMTLNNWHQVSLGVKAGNFYITVDESTTEQNLGAASLSYRTVATDSPWLTLGDGFTGTIAGLRLYDWDSAALLELSASNGNYDVDGNATVSLAVGTNYAQNDIALPAVTIALYTDTAEVLTANVLSKALADRLGATYADVMGNDTATHLNVSQSMPMARYFPAPGQAVTSFSQRFVQYDSSVSKQVILSNLAWTATHPRLTLLKEKVAILQNYFNQQTNADATNFAAEYLQEAIMEASYGSELMLDTMVTGLVVWAELVESSPLLAAWPMNAIQNTADFWAWLRFMALPANGWATNIIPIPKPHMTCDRVTPDVNIGTPLEFSSTPCRATGVQVAAAIENMLDVSPEVLTEPALLTEHMKTLVAGLRQAPFEFTKLLFPTDAQLIAGNTWNMSPIKEAHAAAPAVYAIRALLVLIKQAIKQAGKGAPANFVNFMRGGTTSRFEEWEMLLALGYLATRLDNETFCTTCEKLNSQVSANVLLNMSRWFSGMGLAAKGVITEDDIDRKSCMIGNQAHGAALELVATAAYHALFEFAPNGDQYQILLADPRDGDNEIEVGLMTRKRGRTDPVHVSGSPQGRAPDLVLAGNGAADRYWIELKSWKYNPAYLGIDNELRNRTFPLWNGRAKSTRLRYTQNAHRQHFLDYAATKDKLLSDYWENAYNGAKLDLIKPGKHRTWVQVWKAGERYWRDFKKNAQGRWELKKKIKTLNVATPWIDASTFPTTVTPQFRALQKYLTSAPSDFNSKVFETSIGYKLNEHETNYQNPNVSSTPAQLVTATVAPFNLTSMLAIEIGDSGAQALKDTLWQQFRESRIGALYDRNNYTEEEIAALREEITTKMLELLGPFRHLLIEIPLLSYLEDKAGDLVLGEKAEEIQKFARELKLPEFLFEAFCEAP